MTDDLWMLTLNYTNLLTNLLVIVCVCFQHIKFCHLWTEIKLTFSFLDWMPLLLFQVLFIFTFFLFFFWECNVRGLTLLVTGPQVLKALFNFTCITLFPLCDCFQSGQFLPFCLWVSRSMLWSLFPCWVLSTILLAEFIGSYISICSFTSSLSSPRVSLFFFVCLDRICNCSLKHLDNGRCKTTVKWF